MMLAEKHKDSQLEARDACVQTCGLFISESFPNRLSEWLVTGEMAVKQIIK